MKQIACGRQGITSPILLVGIAWLTMMPSIGHAQDNPKARADELVRSSGIKAGLCVHLGCRDGALTAELAGTGNFLVHGLDKDPAMVQEARRRVRARGLNGRVAIEEASWRQPLPYPDNTVNLLVVDDLPALLADRLSAREIPRVLAPNGAAYLGSRPAGPATASPPAEFKALLAKAGLEGFEMVSSMGGWARVTKRPDPRTDEWTHFLHNPGRNSVSNDAVVGPAGATQLRWLNGPYYFNSPPGLIAAGGLVFTGHQEWKPGGKSIQWTIVARDAYNGCEIWRRALEYYDPKSMAADGDRLFLPLEGRLGAVDVRTGKTLFTVPEDAIPPSRPADCQNIGTIAVLDGTIVVRDKHRHVGNVYAVDAATRKLLWKQRGIRTVAGEGLVYVSDAEALSAFDLRTGKERWKLPLRSLPNLAAGADPLPAQGIVNRMQYAYGRLIIIHQLKKGSQVYAISAKDGKCLWDYHYPVKVSLMAFSYPDEIWVATAWWCRDGFQVALDPATGKEKRRFPALIPNSCATPRGVRNYLLGSPKGSCAYLSRSTLELIHVRNFCRTQCAGEGGNQVPAYGLQYFLPVTCICNGSLLRGVFATGADEAPLAISKDRPHPLVTGSARAPALAAGRDTDWPMCRKDVKRSNATPTAGPAKLVKLWEAGVGEGRVSPPTVAGGLAYAADVEGLQLCAFDAATGKQRWRYLTGCRVDVPPTIEKGLCLFGGRDGWVYCLDAQTGQLIWRYRAAPAERRIVVSGRMESPWPVVGGVLVQNGVAYAAAGRTCGVDGGVFLHALEPATGKCLKRANLTKLSLAADWMVGDGANVYMNGYKWDPGKDMRLRQDSRVPPGLLQVRVQPIANMIWSTEPPPIEWRRVSVGDGRVQGDVVAFTDDTSYAAGPGSQLFGRKAKPDEAKQHYLVSAGAATWRVTLPLQFIAIVRAGRTLYAAGIPPTRDAAAKAELWALSADDGKVLGTFPLEAYPVPDGLAVADGRLYVALQNGRILCLGK